MANDENTGRDTEDNSDWERRFEERARQANEDAEQQSRLTRSARPTPTPLVRPLADWQINLRERLLAIEAAHQSRPSQEDADPSSSRPGDSCCRSPSTCVPANGRCRIRDDFMAALKERDPDEFERQNTRFSSAGELGVRHALERTRDFSRGR